jgi:hypothetical protein
VHVKCYPTAVCQTLTILLQYSNFHLDFFYNIGKEKQDVCEIGHRYFNLAYNTGCFSIELSLVTWWGKGGILDFGFMSIVTWGFCCPLTCSFG